MPLTIAYSESMADTGVGMPNVGSEADRRRTIPSVALVGGGQEGIEDSEISARRVLYGLLATSKRLTDRLRRWHESRGVPLFTQETLAVLASKPAQSGASPTELAELLGITTGTMTRRLDVLENREYVTRRRAGEDGRRRLVRLTDKGQRTLDKLRHQQDAFEERLMHELSDEQLQQLDSCLRVLLQGVTKEDDDA